MIAFYATSGTVLVNILNLRMNQLSIEPADLYIMHLYRIPADLIEISKNSGLFTNVIVMDNPSAKCHVPTPKYKYSFVNYMIQAPFHLINKTREKIHYFNLLNKISKKTVYNAIVSYGLGHNALFIIRRFYKYNPNIKIYIIDEGSATIYSDLDRLCNPLDTLVDLFEKVHFCLLWFFLTGHRCISDAEKYRGHITDCYMYTPKISKLYSDEKSIEFHELRSINSLNSVRSLLLPLTKKIDVSEYNKRQFFVLANLDGTSTHPSHPVFLNLVRVLSSVITYDQIIIKSHPAFPIDDEYYDNIFPEVYVDNRKDQLETIYLDIDLNKKVLISIASTAMLYPKYIFDQEPYIIFTYKIYPNVKITAFELAQLNLLASDLKSSYVNKNKIFIPESLSEFKSILINHLS